MPIERASAIVPTSFSILPSILASRRACRARCVWRLAPSQPVWIDASAQVCGLSRPIHVLATSPARVAIPSSWTQIAYPIRDRQGDILEHVIAIPAPSQIRHGTLPLRALVRLTHGPTREPRLTRLAATEALPRFWDPTLRPDDVGLGVAISVLRTTAAFQLTSSTLDEALACVESLLGSAK